MAVYEQNPYGRVFIGVFVCLGLSWCACAGSTTPRCGRPSWRSSAASKMTWSRPSVRSASSTARRTSLPTQRSWTWRRWAPWRTFRWSLRPACSLSRLPQPRPRRAYRPRAQPSRDLPHPLLRPRAHRGWTNVRAPARGPSPQQTGPLWCCGARLTRASLTRTWTAGGKTSVPCPCPNHQRADPHPPTSTPFHQSNLFPRSHWASLFFAWITGEPYPPPPTAPSCLSNRSAPFWN